MRFTYPKMKSPSMQLTQVDADGAVLVYRSHRAGFSRYLMGQCHEIARSFYNLEIQIRILESRNDSTGGTTGPIQFSGTSKSVFVKYRLDFDNRDYVS